MKAVSDATTASGTASSRTGSGSGSGSAPQPAGSETAAISAAAATSPLVELSSVASRFRNAVTSPPVATMATTSQPDDACSLILATRLVVSYADALTEAYSNMRGP